MASFPELLPTLYAPANRPKVLACGFVVALVAFSYLSARALHGSVSVMTLDAFLNAPLVLAALATVLFAAKLSFLNQPLRGVAIGGVFALAVAVGLSFVIAMNQVGVTTVLSGHYAGSYPTHGGLSTAQETTISPAAIVMMMGIHAVVWLGLSTVWVALCSVATVTVWRVAVRAVQAQHNTRPSRMSQRVKVSCLIGAGIVVCAFAVVPMWLWVTSTDRSGLPSLLIVIVGGLLFAAVRQTCTHRHVPTTGGVVGVITMLVGTSLQALSGAITFASKYSADRGEYFDWPTFWNGIVTCVLGGGGLSDWGNYSDFFYNVPVSVMIFSGSQWVVLFGVCVLGVAMWRTLRVDRLCCTAVIAGSAQQAQKH